MLCLRALQPTGAPRGRRNAAPRSRQPYNGGGAGRGTANGSTTTAARTPGVSARNQLLTIWKWGSLLRHKQSCMASSAVFYLRQQSRVITWFLVYMALGLDVFFCLVEHPRQLRYFYFRGPLMANMLPSLSPARAQCFVGIVHTCHGLLSVAFLD